MTTLQVRSFDFIVTFSLPPLPIRSLIGTSWNLMEPHEDNDVTDTAIRPELLRRSRRAAAKVATDNIHYVQDFLEDEPSPD